MSAALPTHMKAVVLKDHDGTPQSLAVADLSLPPLRSGHVLIKLAATSIGPDRSDVPERPVRDH